MGPSMLQGLNGQIDQPKKNFISHLDIDVIVTMEIYILPTMIANSCYSF